MTDLSTDTNTAPSTGTKTVGIYDWFAPWKSLLKLLNVVARDAIGILLFAVVTHWFELGLAQISPQPWVLVANGVSISLSDIVHYDNLVFLVSFLGVALRDLMVWVWRQ